MTAFLLAAPMATAAPREVIVHAARPGAVARPGEVTSGHEGSCTCGGPAALPAVWEIDDTEPSHLAAAKEVFDRWNAYVDVFRYSSGDGESGINGKNEVAFLDIATISRKYGINIDRSTFAVTFMTPLSAAGDFDACPRPPTAVCGTFTETDVIINSEFFLGWTTTEPPSFDQRAPALYQAALAHELGHTLGFHHNVNDVSVMNLYEDFAAQYISAADVAEARLAYPSRVRQVADLALYPFEFNALLTDYAATTPVEVSPSVVAPGGTIRVRHFQFENVGTESVSNVAIRFYLVRVGPGAAADSLVATLAFIGPFRPGSFWDDGGEGIAIALPGDIPPGTYSLRAVIAGGGAADGVAYNDAFVAPQQISVVAGGRHHAVRH